jgi:CubicO group peptidase (beta-lactamase class C family)
MCDDMVGSHARPPLRISNLALGLLALAAPACGNVSTVGAGADAGADSSSDAADGNGLCSRIDFHAFDDAVSSFVAANGLTGASAVVVHAGCGVMHTQGYGSYTADRVYLVGSSSKVVTTGVLMRLADRGLVDIDAPVGQYLASAAWGANGKPELEMAQMLSNSSGLVGLVDNPLYLPYRCQYQSTGTLADCAKTIYTANDGADRQPPDTSFHYGGGQWQLAGGIAEVVGGTSWAELVAETYATPCGLATFGYTNPFAMAAQAGGLGSALAYPAFFQGNVANLGATQNPSVEGGLYTTAADYGQILLMHLRGGTCGSNRVLSEAAVARMRVDRILQVYGGSTAGQTGRINGGGGFDGYGLGWWVDRADPGVVADPGLYGAFPWLDVPRGYGAFLAIESDGSVGGQLYATVKPILDAAFDAASR